MKGKDVTPHIGIFGRRNVGKSSFINALTGQEVAIVSEMAGTTADPVRKSMEIFGIGPVVLIDTAGIDDSGTLGEKRMARTLEIIKQIDCAVLLIADNMFGEFEECLIDQFHLHQVGYFIVHNKADVEPLSNQTIKQIQQYTDTPLTEFSSQTQFNIEGVLDMLRSTIPDTAWQHPSLLKGIIKRGDLVLLVTPNDSEAPEGRLILPEVMTIRDVLDNDAINVVVKETEVESFLQRTGIKPALVVTDSRIFGLVGRLVPPGIPLTSFSVAFAHMRGPFDAYINGTRYIDKLKDGDQILILESCTHQVTCDDIGRSKIPRWLSEYTQKQLNFDIIAGLTEIKHPITDYAMVIQCGGCMITRKQVFGRLSDAMEAGVPVTNYGLTIAYMHGLYDKAIAPFIT